MRLTKAGIILIALLIMVFPLSGCSRDDETDTAVTRTVAVQRGDIEVSIAGTGNLAYSKSEDLAFEIAGYVEEVLVSEGDSVAEGDEIARLNTADWEDDIKALTRSLSQSQRSLMSARQRVTKARRALVSTQAAVTRSERTVAAREMDVRSAELSLKNLEYDFNEMDVIKDAIEEVDSLKTSLDVAVAISKEDGSSGTDGYLARLQADYEAALAKLDSIKSGLYSGISQSEALQIAKYRLKIEGAGRDIEDARIAVENARKAVSDARLAVKDAEKAVSDAELDLADAEQNVTDVQAELDETSGLSPIVKAPFDGFITDVKVSGGDEVNKGTIAAVIADPDQFEAEILVTENDIFSVQTGSEATVSLEAMSGLVYPARITFISPTAKISSGVVNYNVTVELTSLKPVNTAMVAPRFQSGAGPSGLMPSGTPPSDMSRRTPPSGWGGMQGTPPAMARGEGMATFPGPAASAGTGASDGAVTLKEGLSATVTIVTEQVSGVLVVLSRAITTKNKQKTVQVISGTDTETRLVTVGISDGTNTEVKSGLAEGDQVTYKASSSSVQNNQGSMRIGIGGGAIRIR
ncbi:MAG: HlyD family efflux transporter periplasmic adaptor subunit [Dehalococcoidales bacterium]|nr:HlyD family efflux transporter periplasmic adaptor subunit [Dehalococcoidales bacterium]